jgi:hypothetical protein
VEIDGTLYCTAGFGQKADWYRNLLVNPTVEVWLPNGWWVGRAKDVTTQGDNLPILRQVLINSGLAARVAGLDPLRMGDERLRQATAGYRLVHIRRIAALTGPGGPGDLAWLWPWATFSLLFLWVCSRSRKKL